MHLEFIVEDSSGARLVEVLLPKLIGPHGEPHTWRVHPYKGIGFIPHGLRASGDPRKRILLQNLPRILKGYAKTPGIDAIVVLVDSDRKDCVAFLTELRDLAATCGRPDTLIRLAIEEIEAWYLADRDAISAAYKTPKFASLNNYIQDSVCGTWEVLADVVYPGGSKAVKKVGWPKPGELKHEWAQQIGPRLSLDNSTSPSFAKFCQGVLRLVASGKT